MSHTKTLATLILSGATLGACQVHTPNPKPRPGKEITEKYLTNGKYDNRKSNQRREEIMQDLRQIKKQVKIKAESFQIDSCTRITGYTAKQKTIVRCTKLMARIAERVV